MSEVEVRSREELRAWLRDNHASAGTCWLVVYKKHSDHYLPWGEVVSELLCWGWIDSVTRKVDADRTSVRISPRSPSSAWSAVNKAKVEEARAAGLMTPAGEAAIEVAVSSGMWTFLDDVERLEVPEDLASALDGDRRAVWDAYPRSVKRGTLEWIKTARSGVTRARRIAEVSRATRAGERPAPFGR